MTADNSRKPAQSSMNRKISKGVIERKRRARINQSLSDLKFLILSESTDKTLHSKLDKAEILERTLLHIQALQQQSQRQNIYQSNDAREMNVAFSNGYLACVTEVDRFLTGQKVNQAARHQITSHLTAHAQSIAACRAAAHQPEVHQKLPSLRFFGASSPSAAYAVVPGSPAPSTFSDGSSSSGNDSRLSPFSLSNSEMSVWRPW